MTERNRIESLLAQEEGKTLEFKENCRSLSKIVQTVVAFANTAGGVLVIGIRDRTKEVVGLPDPLADEEKLANAFADSIQPLLIPEIQISAWRDRELIIVSIPHALRPHHVKSEGIEKGVYIRLGSTNRRAGPEIIEEIRRLSRNTFFDEQPCTEVNSEAVDFRAASEFFSEVSRPLNEARMMTLGLLVNRGGKNFPTRGAILLFGKNRRAEDPAGLLKEHADESHRPLRRGDVGLQGGDPALKVPDPPGVLPAGEILDDDGDPTDLGEKIAHDLPVGLEAGLVGLLQEAD